MVVRGSLLTCGFVGRVWQCRFGIWTLKLGFVQRLPTLMGLAQEEGPREAWLIRNSAGGELAGKEDGLESDVSVFPRTAFRDREEKALWVPAAAPRSLARPSLPTLRETDAQSSHWRELQEGMQRWDSRVSCGLEKSEQ